MAATPKKPQDHKAPKGATTEVEVCGLTLTVPSNVADDYEIVEVIAKSTDNPGVIVDLFNRVYGPGQMEMIKDHVRADHGYVSVDALAAILRETLQAVAPN